jgi:ribosomal-protein-alanine N-acetyltransferase
MASNVDLNFEKRTRRLVLRPFRKTDFAAWRECFTNSLPSKNRWDFASVDSSKYTKLEYEILLKQYRSLEAADSAFRFAVFEKKTGAMIGFSLVQHIIKSPIFQSGEIGWAINNRFWGNGYATEFAEATAQIAFKELGLRRVEAAIGRGNVRSVAVAKKLGFQRIGMSRGHFVIRGTPRDMVIYSRTKS